MSGGRGGSARWEGEDVEREIDRGGDVFLKARAHVLAIHVVDAVCPGNACRRCVGAC